MKSPRESFDNKILKEEVGKRMRERRLQLGLTQEEVAAHIGVAQPVYQRFEKGTCECTFDQLRQLCRLFDVSADYLLGLSDY